MAEDALANALKKHRLISIVWFVFEDHALWLLPVYGSRTQWYRNLQANRAITIQAGSERRDLRPRLLKDAQAVRKVIRWFREKYTAEQIMRWYTRLDVAVQIPLPIRRT